VQEKGGRDHHPTHRNLTDPQQLGNCSDIEGHCHGLQLDEGHENGEGRPKDKKDLRSLTSVDNEDDQVNQGQQDVARDDSTPEDWYQFHLKVAPGIASAFDDLARSSLGSLVLLVK
jgi:uncharacterized protein YgiM (DUF1202 family)